MIDKNLMQMLAFGQTSEPYDSIDQAVDYALLDTIVSMQQSNGQVRYHSVTIYVPSYGHEEVIARIVARNFTVVSKIIQSEEELLKTRGAVIEGADADSFPLTQITISWPIFNPNLH